MIIINNNTIIINNNINNIYMYNYNIYMFKPGRKKRPLLHIYSTSIFLIPWKTSAIELGHLPHNLYHSSEWPIKHSYFIIFWGVPNTSYIPRLSPWPII